MRIIVALVISLFLVGCGTTTGEVVWELDDGALNDIPEMPEAAEQPSNPLLELPDVHQCTESQKNTDYCALVIEPVCAWSKDCDTFDCVREMANFCFACMASDIDYWVEGQC